MRTVNLRSELSGEEVRFLQAKMNEFNQAQGAPYDWKALHLLFQDDEGKILGGLLGWTMWSLFHIETLWVEDTQRGSGIGTQLMKIAENEAIQRGCILADVDTFCFQARGFYEKHGYEVFGQFDKLASSLTRYYLRKRLGP